jgi:hypothetical protein
MRYSLLILMISLLSFKAQGQGFVDDKLTKAANIRLTVSNLGLIGNAFSGKFDLEAQPSCEFPANTGIEHVFQGGLWLGCELGGTSIAVTTGAADDSRGYSTGASNFEFSAEPGSTLLERSSLSDNPLYAPEAISHQDFVSDFTDRNKIAPGGSIIMQGHNNPLGADIHMEAYNWNYSFANFFVILNFTITHNGTEDWVNFHPGYWFDGVVRNVNITQPGGSAFFNKGGNGFIDSLYAAYEFDAVGDVGYTDSYVAMKFLGAEYKDSLRHPAIDTAWNVLYNTWQFRSIDPKYFYPADDLAKYGKLKSGLNQDPCWNGGSECPISVKNFIRQPNNRSSLISIGNFERVKPGEKIQFTLALVCARKKGEDPAANDTDFQKEDLIRNLNWAQTTYNGEDANFNGILDAGEDRDGNGKITRFVLPSPPDAPIVKMIPEQGKITLYWTDKSERSIDPISKKEDFEGYRVYTTRTGFEITSNEGIAAALTLSGEYDRVNGIGYDAGMESIRLEEPIQFAGDPNLYSYRYVIENVQDGWQHGVAVTAFDSGDKVNNLESLESAQLVTLKRVFAGMKANPDFANGEPFVYPNPYYARAEWEGKSVLQEDRKLMFANLPANSEVSIYSAAGDLIDRFSHSGTYSGNDIRWYQTFSDPESAVFSGGEHGWDLLSLNQQLIARGIYVFVVKDLDSGQSFQGKFVILK